ncbi:unnamed protein product [Cuscuta epithymum]|uniref:Peroxidase n=1 Tax=Cuscuta epithymum TaxID=186058 RepID=A0AAV0FGE9_9ASTE|nr:unnamed protein product [Cuscuta epithymum]
MTTTRVPPSLNSVAFLLFSSLLFVMTSAQLSANFYSKSCPNALSKIKEIVNSAVQNETRMGASLLRLHFHDCFVNGCDASVLLDDTKNFTGEKTARANINSARGFEVIDAIKAALENSSCVGVVSCADILAVAARDSVVALGGPSWNVLLGRRDSRTASLAMANTDIPGPNFNLNQLNASFLSKGLTFKDMVTLSGAHTIGLARCTTFRNHIYNDSNINVAFARSLKQICPSSGGDNNLTSLDYKTPTRFDNTYYSNLKERKGVLHSDQELFNNGSADSIVNDYSSNSKKFASDFANAMVKMSNLSPLTGSSGLVRKNCRIAK